MSTIESDDKDETDRDDRRSRKRPPGGHGEKAARLSDAEPESDVDLASMDSFPASDPPPFWNRKPPTGTDED